MKVVMQCAARKQPDAKTFIAAGGRRVAFVGRPDDDCGDGQTWRKQLLVYNKEAGRNPLGLVPAYQLYAHDAYRALVDRFGLKHVFILSAGWGLIPAAFLTPYYDITFSASADAWKRRRMDNRYEDFCLIGDDADEVIFPGGKDYLPFFCRLTAPLRARKTVFFNSSAPPDLPAGFTPVRYHTTTRTN